MQLSIFCTFVLYSQSEKCVLDNNLFIYMNHIKNLQEDFKTWFKDLLNMEIPEWIIFLFGVEAESAYLDTSFKEEFTEKSFNLEVKTMYTFTGIGYY